VKRITKPITRGLNAIVWKEDDLFIAKTLELEMASQGKTSAEALDNLEEAIELYFEGEKIPAKRLSLQKHIKLHRVFPKINYA